MSKNLIWPEPRTINKPRWPGWVRQLVGPCRMTRVPGQPPWLRIRAGQVDRFALLEARVSGAYMMDGATFQTHTRDAYLALAGVMGGLRARHPLRFWNYVPFINTPAGPGLDRYMVFNAGRYEAFSAWLGGPDGFARLLPTATAVGHTGSDLELHVLACTQPGLPVENPRQRPAYQYSTQYGPLPPCFSRAIVLPTTGTDPPLILVGGTASVSGEDSVHGGDVRLQTQETLANLGSLLHAACAAAGSMAAKPRPAGAEATPQDNRAWLACLRDLRIYFPRQRDQAAILAVVRDHFERLDQIELFPAALCRRELRVEISGVARAPGPVGKA